MDESTGWWPELEDQLRALNRRAGDVLDEQDEPPPDGLPPVGSWLRAVSTNLDGVDEPRGPWHLLTGWNGRNACISVRCCKYRPGEALRAAVAGYLGEPWYRARYRLMVAPGAPSEACRRCEAALGRDASREEADREARHEQAFLALRPDITRLASDATIDDAIRGAQLRELMRGAS